MATHATPPTDVPGDAELAAPSQAGRGDLHCSCDLFYISAVDELVLLRRRARSSVRHAGSKEREGTRVLVHADAAFLEASTSLTLTEMAWVGCAALRRGCTDAGRCLTVHERLALIVQLC